MYVCIYVCMYVDNEVRARAIFHRYDYFSKADDNKLLPTIFHRYDDCSIADDN